MCDTFDKAVNQENNRSSSREYLSKVRLCEEVPGVPKEEQYFIWNGKLGKGFNKVVWRGETSAAGYAWAKENNLEIEVFESFEP